MGSATVRLLCSHIIDHCLVNDSNADKVLAEGKSLKGCRVYFTELQQTAAKVQELIGKITTKDPATGAKLSAAVISVLQSTAKNLEVAQ